MEEQEAGHEDHGVRVRLAAVIVAWIGVVTRIWR